MPSCERNKTAMKLFEPNAKTSVKLKMQSGHTTEHASVTLTKSDKHPKIRNRYLALRKRRSHKRGEIAISRMLLIAIFHILKKKEPYTPVLYRSSDRPSAQRVVSVEKSM